MTELRGAGLILEGGATRGIFTAGVLDYLMEKEVYFPYVVGVSAGACNAVSYVSKQLGRTRDCMIHKEEKPERYDTIKRVMKTRSLFDMDLIFDRYPNSIYPFDYEEYFQSSMHCEMVVTNCITGKAEYLGEKSSKERLMKICRASSSIPLASPIVNIQGTPYVDGGVADSIPILHSLKTGHRKNVLILTRNKGYRKKPIRKSRPLYAAALKEYPELVKTLFRRAYVYNKTLTYIEKWEKEGKVFVIRPEIKTVSRTEQDEKILTEFYEHGYNQMDANFTKLQEFLKNKK